MAEGEKIVQIHIEEEMKSAYIDYSMSVIVSRALPDIRDGLKPVQRRVLFGMRELGVMANRPYKKSARIVGEVLGKYHPHGDSSVYYAMVRMAQPWSLRYPLADGQGNFGSVDGDPPAAMRYTEARLQRIAEEMLSDIDKNTVDFQLNFDDSLEEPTVLPAKIPNLLVNGSSGIAVGMATNMPPHNLSEVVDATVAYIDNNDISIDELITHVKAPDFPTGGIIYGYQGVKHAFETGRGRIVVRAKTQIEVNPSGREKIVVTEIPYMVNKAELIQKVGDLVNEKKIDGIVHANDESDRTGMRIVFALKKDANSNVVLNTLFKLTALQSTFSVNNIALVDGRPKLLNIKELISHFVDHRHEVIVRRTQYELAQAEKDAHIREGLLIALNHLDEVIALIRNSKTPDEAREGLIEKFQLSEVQAKAILEMRLQRLTGLERDKIKQEYDELITLIAHLREVLENRELRMNIIKEELLEIKRKYGDKRRTEIVYASEEFNPEDFYADEKVVITISNLGYIKRTSLTEFKTQNRGGMGSKASDTREEDFVRHIYVASMHNTLLLFTEKGKCLWLKVWDIPEGSRTGKGRAIQNILNIEPDDKVRAYIHVKNMNDKEYIENHYIVLCTRNAVVKKMPLSSFSKPRTNGITAITVRDGDKLLEALLTDGSAEIMLASNSGKAIRFNEKTVRPMGRTASGVRGMSLSAQERLVGMIAVSNPEIDVLVVTENGFGKRSKIEDYRVTNRGGKGVKALNMTDKTGALIGIESVSDNDDLMITNRSGLTLRLAVSSLRIMGRATQGVKLIRIKEGDAIASLTKIEDGSIEEPLPSENGEIIDPQTDDDFIIEPETDNLE